MHLGMQSSGSAVQQHSGSAVQCSAEQPGAAQLVAPLLCYSTPCVCAPQPPAARQLPWLCAHPSPCAPHSPGCVDDCAVLHVCEGPHLDAVEVTPQHASIPDGGLQAGRQAKQQANKQAGKGWVGEMMSSGGSGGVAWRGKAAKGLVRWQEEIRQLCPAANIQPNHVARMAHDQSGLQ